MKYSQVFIITLTLLSLTGCGFTNMLRIRNANDDIVPLWKNNQTQADLVTHYIGVKPYVEVSINGIDGFKFLLDTGATFSMLNDSKKVNRLNLEKGYSLPIHGWGDDEPSTGYQTKANTVSLTGVDSSVGFRDVTFAYIPLAGSKYFLDQDELIYDGVLGHDFLHHFSWTFDKQLNKISISTAPYKTAYKDMGKVTTLPFDTFLSKLRVASEINFGQGQIIKQELIIDTGSRYDVKVDAAYIHNEDIELPSAQITAADFGLSGQTIHPRVTVPKVRLGDLAFTNVKTNVIGDIDGDGDDWWIVGSGLLSQFKTVIDYHSSKIHIIAYEDATYKSSYNLLGLELRDLQNGHFIVRYVFPQMASYAFDIKKGDIISKIDGKRTKNISLANWLSISDQAGSHLICRVREQEKCFTIVSKEIAGYSDN
ncbi:aspartyl protease family protein [Colwelliaceae bacterium BS250]